MLKQLQQILNDYQLSYTETLQALWSDYGEIARYYSPKLAKSIIVKSVTPPSKVNHPRGWHSKTAHQRKLASYEIEANFYQHYAKQCDTDCYVPQKIALSKSSQVPNNQILIMEDLQSLGFNDKEQQLTLLDIKAVIRWLAYFHAKFMAHEASDLWPIGTYWHLGTRQDEYNKMEKGPLKQAAVLINNALNNAKYQTIVHGDAKLANFCFGSSVNNENDQLRSNKMVAGVDFQYVGKGVGVKDLAYFLGSCLSDDDLNLLHNDLLEYYFQNLSSACTKLHPHINVVELESEWRQLYSVANADFLRFLQGWSPGHYKINNYLHSQSKLALKHLTTNQS